MDIIRLGRLSPLHYYSLLILHSAHRGHPLLAVPPSSPREEAPRPFDGAAITPMESSFLHRRPPPSSHLPRGRRADSQSARRRRHAPSPPSAAVRRQRQRQRRSSSALPPPRRRLRRVVVVVVGSVRTARPRRRIPGAAPSR